MIFRFLFDFLEWRRNGYWRHVSLPFIVFHSLLEHQSKPRRKQRRKQQPYSFFFHWMTFLGKTSKIRRNSHKTSQEGNNLCSKATQASNRLAALGSSHASIFFIRFRSCSSLINGGKLLLFLRVKNGSIWSMLVSFSHPLMFLIMFLWSTMANPSPWPQNKRNWLLFMQLYVERLFLLQN